MSYESDDKMVSHPDHYNSGKYEVIDIIEEFTKGLSGLEAVCTGNAIKYILRWKKKGGYQDLEKAMWYIQHMLDKHKEAEHKPLNVVIHKLANGNYAIENAPEEPDTVFVTGEKIDKEEVRSCNTCKFKRSSGYEDPCHTCFSNAEKGDEYSLWESEFEESDDTNSMDQEESDDSTPIKEVHHCGTCEHQWSTKGDCPRMNKKRLIGGIGCTSDMIACDQWELTKEVLCDRPDERELDAENDEILYKAHEQESMNQEESDLSVPISKSSSGVYIPDGKPWTTKDAKNLADDHFNNAGAP